MIVRGAFYMLQTRAGSWQPSKTYDDEVMALEAATLQIQSFARQRPPTPILEVPIAVHIYVFDENTQVRPASYGLDESQAARVFNQAHDDFLDEHVGALNRTVMQVKQLRRTGADLLREQEVLQARLDKLEGPPKLNIDPAPPAGTDGTEAQRTGEEPV